MPTIIAIVFVGLAIALALLDHRERRLWAKEEKAMRQDLERFRRDLHARYRDSSEDMEGWE